jgi:hypothetical protein
VSELYNFVRLYSDGNVENRRTFEVGGTLAHQSKFCVFSKQPLVIIRIVVTTLTIVITETKGIFRCFLYCCTRIITKFLNWHVENLNIGKYLQFLRFFS